MECQVSNFRAQLQRALGLRDVQAGLRRTLLRLLPTLR
jgi:hypothetical protein